MNHHLKKTVASTLPGNILCIQYPNAEGDGFMMRFPTGEPLAKPLSERLAFAWNFIRGIGEEDFAAYRMIVINPEWVKEKRSYAAANRVLADQVDLPGKPWFVNELTHPDDGRTVTYIVGDRPDAGDGRTNYALLTDPKIAAFVATQRATGPALAEAVVYLTHENERLAKLLVEATNKANAKKGGK